MATSQRIETQAGAEDAAAGRLQHRRLDARIAEDDAGAEWAAAIAGLDALAVDVDALGAGHADAALRPRQDVRQQARRRRLAVDAGDGGDGDASALSAGKELMEKMVGGRQVVRQRDALLADAVAQEEHARLVEAAQRNAPLPRRLHQGRLGGVRPQTLGQLAQPGQCVRHVERPIVHGGQAQVAAGLQGGAAEILVLEFEGHLVNAVLGRLAGAAKADLGAGQRLQFEGDVFEDVRLPGAASQPREEAAARANAAAVLDQGRKPALQPFVEAG